MQHQPLSPHLAQKPKLKSVLSPKILPQQKGFLKTLFTDDKGITDSHNLWTNSSSEIVWIEKLEK